MKDETVSKKLGLFKWGMVGFILLSVSAAEFLAEPGRTVWSIGYWLTAIGALWSASVGYRFNRRKALIKTMPKKGVDDARIRRRLAAVSLIFLSAGFSVAYWGLVVRFIVHGTLWQALPFYAAGFCLMILWWPRDHRSTADE